jgi:hypothetical protein
MEMALFQDVFVRDVQPYRTAFPLCQGDILICLTKSLECVNEIYASSRRRLPRRICQKDHPVQMVD